jgi:hypothetical protein
LLHQVMLLVGRGNRKYICIKINGKRMEVAEGEGHKRSSPAPYPTFWNVEGNEAHTSSLEHLEGSTKGLDEVLQTGFIMGLKMDWFDMLKSLEDFRITLEEVTMENKWAMNLKRAWEVR